MQWRILIAFTVACSSGSGGDKPKPAERDKPAGSAATVAKPPEPATGPARGGCDSIAIDGICDEYFGTATADAVKAICDRAKVAYVESCPKDHAIGRCALQVGQPDERHRWFYEPANTEAFMKTMCKKPNVLLAP